MANINEQILNLQREPLAVGAGGAVNSVNGQTGDVVLTAEDVGALPDSTVIPTKVSELDNDSDFQTGSEVSSAIGIETTAREGADINLQGQIDALSAASDVTDIVGTYADLQAYDTTKLKDNDIIKVLQDEEHDNETTYYRWSTSTQTFTLIGEEGPYYTKSAADQKFQEKLTASTNVAINANNEISADIPVFTGTDGVDAGTAGKVPAPATTDAGKYLKADGTWSSVGGAIDYEISNNKSIAVIVEELFGVEKGGYAVLRIRNTATSSKYLYAGSDFSDRRFTIPPNGDCVMTLFARDKVDNQYTNVYGGFLFPQGTNSTNMYMFGGNRTGTGYMTIILGRSSIVDDLTSNSATLVLSAKQGKVLKDLVDSLVVKDAGAPTTATVGTVGKLYEDTTNGKLYICTDATNPYVWEEVGGGGGLAPTTTFWGQAANNGAVRGDIGLGVDSSDGYTHWIKNSIYSGVTNYSALILANGLAAFGLRTTDTSGAQYRFTETDAYFSNPLHMAKHNTTLYNQIKQMADPTDAQDAATKNYVDTAISPITNTQYNNLWSNA